MKFTERSFDGSRMEDGDHTLRIENPLYDGEKHNISVRAVAVGGECDGSFILDYYNLARKNGEDTFKIGDFEFVVGYAKYLIEYLDSLHVPDDTLLTKLIKKVE